MISSRSLRACLVLVGVTLFACGDDPKPAVDARTDLRVDRAVEMSTGTDTSGAGDSAPDQSPADTPADTPADRPADAPPTMSDASDVMMSEVSDVPENKDGMCGGTDEACCVEVGPPCRGDRRACMAGVCRECGGDGEPCCAGDAAAACDNDTTCNATTSTCVECGRRSGAPCCAGNICSGAGLACVAGVCTGPDGGVDAADGGADAADAGVDAVDAAALDVPAGEAGD
jgi:hypothetical protein